MGGPVVLVTHTWPLDFSLFFATADIPQCHAYHTSLVGQLNY